MKRALKPHAAKAMIADGNPEQDEADPHMKFVVRPAPRKRWATLALNARSMISAAGDGIEGLNNIAGNGADAVLETIRGCAYGWNKTGPPEPWKAEAMDPYRNLLLAGARVALPSLCRHRERTGR